MRALGLQHEDRTRWRGMPLRWLLAACLCLGLCLDVRAEAPADTAGPAATAPSEGEKLFRIGVLAKRGRQRCLDRWRATAEYLTQAVPGAQFRVVPLDFGQVELAVRGRQVEFLLVNPAIFVRMNARYRLSPLATLTNLRLHRQLSTFGGVIFCRADHPDIYSLADLKGRTFMAVDRTSFGGWIAAHRELDAAGLDVGKDLASLSFGGTHDEVVYAVRDGLVEAGTVRSDTLERMAREKLIDLDRFRVIPCEAVQEDFPFLLSTRLYPEWPFAALAHTDGEVARQVTVALYEIAPEDAAAGASSTAGWSTPHSYQAVADCLQQLGLEPFARSGPNSIWAVFRAHWLWGVGGLLTLLGAVAVAVRFVWLSVRLKQAMRAQQEEVEARKLAEENFQAVLSQIPCGVVLVGQDHIIRWSNQYAQDLIGGEAGENLCGQSCKDHLCTTGQKRCPILDDNIPVNNSERVLRRHDGQTIPILKTVSRIQLGGETVLLETFVDISRQKESARKLHKAIEEQQAIFESSLVGIMVLENRILTKVNGRMAEMLGYRPEEIVGKGPEQLHLSMENFHEFGQKYYWRLADHDLVQVEYPLRHKDGHTVWCQFHGKAIDPPDLSKGAVWVIDDITERKKAEKTLGELATVTEQAAEGIVLADLDERVRYANHAWMSMHGWKSSDELHGRHLSLFHTKEQYWNEVVPFSKIVQETGRNTGEIGHLRKDGTTFPTMTSIVLLKDETGKPYAMAKFAQDISGLKQAEEQIRSANQHLKRQTALAREMAKKAEQANVAKSEFLANMSHEIRTPMNGIIGMTDLLGDTRLDGEQQQYVETVSTCAEQLLALINDILDFSKIEARKLEMEHVDFDLPGVVEDVAEMVAGKVAEKHLELLCFVSPEIPPQLCGDPGRLRQILLNLATNAVKFTETGEVDMRAELDSRDDGSVTVRFAVRDTGIGIPKDRINRLFESFSQVDTSTTRKFGGTGLGLAISKQLVEMMGGHIGVDSTPGEGSTFWFTAVFQTGQTPAAQPEPVMDIRDARILVVDDNATNRLLLGKYLDAWGCNVTEAASADEALTRIADARRNGQAFDIALLDRVMPEVDGEELGRRIKALPDGEGIRLAMLSSASEQGEIERLKNIGFAQRLFKPIRQSQLLDCLQNLLGQHTRPPERTNPKTDPDTAWQKNFPDGLRILLAEDNIINQRVALHVLTKKLGLDADVANNGREAVEALQQREYDVVLMDCQMPEMDGYEATARIRDRQSGVCNPDIKIIAMTANAMKGDREKCIHAGMDDYVPKPVKPKELAEALHRALAETSSADPDEQENEHDDEPLVSLLIDDPDLAEVVEFFLDSLEETLQSLRNAVGASQWPAVASLAHQLKGSGGGCGYPEITDVAAKLEAAAKNADAEKANLHLGKLTRLARRALIARA